MGCAGPRSAGVRVRVAGLAEMQYVAAEHGRPTYPNDFVGTPGYALHAVPLRDAQRAAWERTPPAKRANYAAAGVRHPFDATYGLGPEPAAHVRLRALGRSVPLAGSLLYASPDAASPCGFVTFGTYSQMAGCGVGFGAFYATSDAGVPAELFFSHNGAPRRPAAVSVWL
jgi:hypothetical protein